MARATQAQREAFREWVRRRLSADVRERTSALIERLSVVSRDLPSTSRWATADALRDLADRLERI
jgi:hypothetical protein